MVVSQQGPYSILHRQKGLERLVLKIAKKNHVQTKVDGVYMEILILIIVSIILLLGDVFFSY